MIRLAHCYGCRSERHFKHLSGVDYSCLVCERQRAISIDPVTETVKGGEFNKFWCRVKITPYCWVWTGPGCNGRSAPLVHIGRSSTTITRRAWVLLHGTNPKERIIRTCGNHLCVKPKHLMLVPQKKMGATLSRLGMLKGIRQKPRLLCRRGHRLAGHNKGIQKAGNYCRKCHNEANKKSYWRRKQLTAQTAVV